MSLLSLRLFIALLLLVIIVVLRPCPLQFPTRRCTQNYPSPAESMTLFRKSASALIKKIIFDPLFLRREKISFPLAGCGTLRLATTGAVAQSGGAPSRVSDAEGRSLPLALCWPPSAVQSSTEDGCVLKMAASRAITELAHVECRRLLMDACCLQMSGKCMHVLLEPVDAMPGV